VLCRRLTYGFYNNKRIKKESLNLFAVDIRFEKWGKILSSIYPGAVKPEYIVEAYRIIQIVARLGLLFFSIFRKFSNKWKPMYYFHRLQCGILNHVLINNKEIVTDCLLLSCYSYTEIRYQLVVQILVDNIMIYKNSMAVNYGYNEEKITIPDTIYQKAFKKGLIEVYPENNINAEMTIYFFGLVKLHPSSGRDKNESKKLKCVVWDLDNTLWNGILIESDPSQICLRDGVLRTIKNLDERGIVQSIASKNNEDEAIAVLKRLGIDRYFLYPMINWEPKSLNIKKIAELLNIDVNSFAFIDDSPFERSEVSSNLPSMRIYDEHIIETILDLAETKITVTEESRMRRLMYQTEAKRKNIQQEAFADDYITFLKNCNIQIHIEKPDTKELGARCFELIQRTNQLNLSGKKYNETEFDALLQRNDIDTYIIRCEDKYGTYGYTAFLTVKKEKTQLYIDEFAMSCRVAKKYVESGIIAWLEKKYDDIDTVNLRGIKTEKNGLLVSSFTDIGFQVNYNEEMFTLSIAKDDSLKNSDVIGIKL
jgi:FkbH-like protein